MSDWPALSSFCEFIVDCEHKTAPLAAEGHPSIRTPNVGRGRLLLSGVNRVSEQTYRSWTKRAVPRAGDLIIAREAPVGNVAIVPPGLEVCLGQRTVLVRPDPCKVVPEFLCYFLLGDYAQARFQATSSGATVAHLNMKDIRNLPVPPLPSLDMQRRIASILSAYDDLIEVNRRRVAVLEEMARGLFEEWFVRFRFPGHEAISDVAPMEGPVPKDWTMQTVGETFELLGGGTPSKTVEDYWIDGTVDWYTPTDLTASRSLFMDRSSTRISPEGLARSSAKLFPANSIMMTSRATIGVISICTGPACTNQGFITCIPNDAVPRSYLYYWLAHNVPVFIAHGTGATFKEITKGVFKKLNILVPHHEVTAAFDRLVRPMHNLVLATERANRALVTARDLLLPRLISGQLSVETAERKLEEVA